MRAEVGDRIVVASGRVDQAVRQGRIAEVQHDGAPPYVVEWSDGHRGLYFPGPDAHVEGPPQPRSSGDGAIGNNGMDDSGTDDSGTDDSGTDDSGMDNRGVEATPPAHARTWSVQVEIVEDAAGGTTAHALLSGAAPATLTGRGEAHAHPRQPEVPEIGDEIAAARALHRLADALLATASDDLTGVLGHEVHVSR
jgi:Domain of unknown function (DUF1876)/Domain of unknown function (DUF1918)